MRAKYLIRIMMAIGVLHTMPLLAEGFEKYPGWDLTKLESGSDSQGKVYYRLSPPNNLPPINIDEISAQRLFSGEMGPSALYNSQLMSSQAKSESDFVYSAKHVGVTMANTTGAAQAGAAVGGGSAGGSGFGSVDGSHNSGMSGPGSATGMPPKAGSGAGGVAGAQGGASGSFNVDPNSPFAAIYAEYAGSAALNGGKLPGGRAPASAGGGKGGAGDGAGVTAEAAEGIMAGAAGRMNNNKGYRDAKSIMNKNGNMKLEATDAVPQAEYDLHGFSCEYAAKHNRKAYSFMGCN